MAKTGLLHPVAAPIDPASEKYGQLPTYTEGFLIGRAVSADVTLTYGNNPFYADNREVNNDTDFQEGTITIGVDEFGADKNGKSALETEKKLLGGAMESTEEGGTAVLHTGASSNGSVVGFGYIKTGQYPDNFVKYWESVWFHKVKFTPTGESSSTKGGSTTWSNPSVTGRIYTIDGVSGDRNLMKKARFDKEADAVAWLNEMAKISEPASGSTEDAV